MRCFSLLENMTGGAGGCLCRLGARSQWWDILSPGILGSQCLQAQWVSGLLFFLFSHILKVSFSVGRGNEATHEAQI